MFRVRLTPTKSKSTAVQVVKYVARKTVIIKHIGSAKTERDLKLLQTSAQEWIRSQTGQLNLISEAQPSSFQVQVLESAPQSPVLLINKSELLSTASVLVYEVLRRFCAKLGFARAVSKHPGKELLLDLVVARIIHPASKLESLKFLQENFQIKYPLHFMYRQLLSWSELKDAIEVQVVKFAKKEFDFDFTIVFYDVTTLYFESFKSDEELKQCGFSKDHKFNQPQLLVGLVVNSQGFPISYDVFPGNKFEGHTFIPMIESLIKKYRIKKFTVVADAAMISKDNVDKLIAKKLHYIVGARLGNLSQVLIEKIDRQLSRVDKQTIRLKTSRGDLICFFSQGRYNKNKHDTQKQIDRAKAAIKDPSKQKRLKFISVKNKQAKLNQELIDKTKKLWGIKGYYTNLENIDNQQIINQYRQLWNVEKSFRIAKSDLQARPIYQRKTEAIKSHLLICFMALAISKCLEIKTNMSLKKCMNALKLVKDARIKNQFGQIITLRSKISPDVDNLINLSH